MQRMSIIVAAVAACIVTAGMTGCENDWPQTVPAGVAERIDSIKQGDPMPAKLAPMVEGIDPGEPIPSELAMQMRQLEAGDPIPRDISAHPLDQGAEQGEQISQMVKPVADPATGGWFGIVASAALGLFGVARDTMARMHKREADRERDDRKRAEDRERSERAMREATERENAKANG